MDSNDFSIVLPSNSSKEFFPNNTTTNFSTRLPREVKLNGKWQVGVSEIHVPCTMLHLTRKDTEITNPDSDRKVYFQHGMYDSLDNLIQAINDGLLEYYHQNVLEKIFYDKKGGYVMRRIYTDKKLESNPVTLTNRVKLILGFENDGELIQDPNEHEKKLTGRKFMTIGNYPACLSRAIPDQLFIYSNLCESCIVGDALAPLLRIVNFDAKRYRYGNSIVKIFTPIAYIPLLNNHFQIIDIDIRDQFGYPIAFEFGTLTVTLHFRREY